MPLASDCAAPSVPRCVESATHAGAPIAISSILRRPRTCRFRHASRSPSLTAVAAGTNPKRRDADAVSELLAREPVRRDILRRMRHGPAACVRALRLPALDHRKVLPWVSEHDPDQRGDRGRGGRQFPLIGTASSEWRPPASARHGGRCRRRSPLPEGHCSRARRADKDPGASCRRPLACRRAREVRADQGMAKDQALYDRFTEGSDSPDLAVASALLNGRREHEPT